MGTVSVWDGERVLEVDGVMVVPQPECAWCPRTVHLKMVKTVNGMLCIFYHKRKLIYLFVFLETRGERGREF